jgi:phosphatidylserine/phosphatidylglycerophosphate/cardiolipin synthase-like enzyme
MLKRLILGARGPLDREPSMAAVRAFFGPRAGFEDVDPDLISRARISIDMAAYVLTERRVLDALEAAAKRGVKIRIYLDPEQPGGRDAAGGRVQQLLRGGNVAARVKAQGLEYMHMKAFHVDGRWLRTGSTNFSFAGEHRQDNDIIVIESRDVAGAFAQQFEQLWTRAGNFELRP